ncbi:MAG: twin-arginine translocation signal domain-containing protein, partial [Bauldia sp.]
MPGQEEIKRIAATCSNLSTRQAVKGERAVNIDLTRRSFLKLTGAGVAATSLGAMGFGQAEAAVAAHVRDFKLATTIETRNICTYCSVACGIIMYSRGDLAAGEKADLIHIEGDADHPTNRGTLCPKG